MTKHARLRVGVVLERRRIDHPWEEFSWRPIAVVPGAPEGEAWRLLRAGDDWAQFLIGTREIELFPRETEGYRYNLSQRQPMVYVLLRGEEADGDHPLALFHVTACPYEAQDYLESGEVLVEGVPMPEAVAAWVKAYIDAYHVDEPFHKRERLPYDPRRGPPPAAPARERS